jgi:hypothetical protein
MSNSTTQLDTIATNQSNKEVVVNALFDAASPGMIWGRHASACSGLTWGYYGGQYKTNAIANGTVALTASATNYVYADPSTGAVSVNTTGTPGSAIPLYTIVTGTTTVTSYTDARSYMPASQGGSFSNQSANYVFAGPASGAAAAPAFRLLVGADIPVFVASGASHAQGGVPDPGSTAGTSRYLREDATWTAPTIAGLGDVTVSEGAAIDGYALTWSQSAGKWVATKPFYVDFVSYFPGPPSANAVLMQVITAHPTTFPSGLSGSYGYCGTAPTGAVSCPIKRTSGGTTTTIGNVNFAAGATSATFTFSSAVTTNAGDLIQVVAPSTADASFANISLALVGTR